MYTDGTKKVDSVIQGKLSQFSKQMKFSDLRCIYETGYSLVFLITLLWQLLSGMWIWEGWFLAYTLNFE